MLTAAQLQARQHGVGGSDAPTVMGVGRITAAQLFYEKAQLLDPEPLDVRTARRGNIIEPSIVDEYVADTGNRVRRHGTKYHPDLPFIFCHPDRMVVGKKRGLECKNRDRRGDDWGPSGSDHVPDEVIVQCMHSMACFPNTEAWDVQVMFPHGDAGTYTIGRDREVIDNVIEADTKFWRLVESALEIPSDQRFAQAEAPPVDLEHPRAAAILKKMYRYHDGTTLDVGRTAPADLERWRRDYEHARDARLAHQKMETLARNHLLDAIGAASVLRFPDGWCYWRKRVEVPARTTKTERQLYYELKYEDPQGRLRR